MLSACNIVIGDIEVLLVHQVLLKLIHMLCIVHVLQLCCIPYLT